MGYDKNEARKYIVDVFNRKGIKYEVYDFNSGATMIHIWYMGKFYAIQPEVESIGISLVDQENPGFDTIPDKRFIEFDIFVKEFNRIFK